MKKTKKLYITTIISGVLLVLLGIFFQMTKMAEGIIPLIFSNVGVIIIIIGVLRYNKLGAGLQQDERTKKLSAYAISYSWLLTLVFANILFWIDYLEVLTLLSTQILGILIFFMTISAAVLQMYYKKRGVINED